MFFSFTCSNLLSFDLHVHWFQCTSSLMEEYSIHKVKEFSKGVFFNDVKPEWFVNTAKASFQKFFMRDGISLEVFSQALPKAN